MLLEDELSKSITSIGSSYRGRLTKTRNKKELKKVRLHVETLLKDSKLGERLPLLPKFVLRECSLGKFLGKGAFGMVHEIQAFAIDETSTTDNLSASDVLVDENIAVVDGSGIKSRALLASNCTFPTGETKFAIKRLRTDVIDDSKLYGQGVINMVVEASMLNSLDHENIIRLHAVGACDPYQQPGFFLIMDRLFDTLEKRLVKWQYRRRRGSILFNVLDRKGDKKLALLEERLVAASELSLALEYLHMKDILHRDFKPENVQHCTFAGCADNVYGPDYNSFFFPHRYHPGSNTKAGQIKLFDFTLAATLRSKIPNDDGTYNLTGMTGSLRYMAPEVALDQPYHKACDVYSFTMLFWEMYALKKPFALLTTDVFMKHVVYGEMRPPISESWPVRIKSLLVNCWSGDHTQRYSMPTLLNVLEKELADLRAGMKAIP